MSGFRPATNDNRPGIVRQPIQNDTGEKHWWQFGVTTWLLIIGLIVINAGIFLKPELLDKLGSHVWRGISIFDIRRWYWWYWALFWISLIGIIGRSLLSGKIEIAEAQGEDADQLILTRWVATVGAIVAAVILLYVLLNVSGGIRSIIAAVWVIAIPWWCWSMFWVALIAGLLIYRLATGSRDEPQRTVTPKTQPTANVAKPKTFNATIGKQARKHVGGYHENEPLLQRLGLSVLAENKTLITLIGVGVVLLTLLVYFGYRLWTMEWIDAEGYPVSRPWWLWVLPCVLLVCGGVGYRVIAVLRENADEKPSRPTSTRTNRPQKPSGFNMPTTKRGGFQKGRVQESESLFSRPVFWIVAGVVGGIILTIILVVLFSTGG